MNKSPTEEVKLHPHGVNKRTNGTNDNYRCCSPKCKYVSKKLYLQTSCLLIFGHIEFT